MGRFRARHLVDGVLNSSGASVFTGAYDAVPGLVHVYEIGRRTLTAYTGNLVRLRRSSDNAESDFGYVEATGELDKAAIAAWLGAGTGFVKTIYDQKGGDNITQATTTKQPTYTASCLNSHAGMTLDGGDYLQGNFTNGGALSQPWNIYIASQLDASVVNDGAYHLLFDSNGDGDPNRAYATQFPGATPDAWQIYAGNGLNDSASNSTWNLWAILFNGASSAFWINNTPTASGNANSQNIDGITLGAALDGSAGWKGPIVSCIICDPSHTEPQRGTTQTAINTFWAVYPF